MMWQETIPATATLGTDNESRMIECARQGDGRAFNQLVRTYQASVYRTALRMLGDADAAADASQDAFIAAYHHLGDYRGGSFRAWLMRIVTNLCYDQLRSKMRNPSASLETLDYASSTGAVPDAAHIESPHEAAERREQNEIIEEGLRRLSPEHRLTVMLADIEEYKYEEIAHITGANIGTVKSRLARARLLLRDYLLQQGLQPQARREAALA